MTSDEIMTGYEERDPNAFALGSSQYSEIYKSYRKFETLGKASEVNPEIVSMEFFLIEAISSIHKDIVNEAKQWKETPDLKEWDSLELKVKLLHAKNNDTGDITKRVFIDLFKLFKHKAWDLWTALYLCGNIYPELKDYLLENEVEDEESNEACGYMIYFFSKKMKLNDKEVKEIFGGFDT